MTDVNAEAVALATHNASCNDLANVTVVRYDYREDPSESWAPDLLLGCDVLYNPASHASIARLIRRLDVTAILADPNRVQADDLGATFETHGVRTWQTPIDQGRVFVVGRQGDCPERPRRA